MPDQPSLNPDAILAGMGVTGAVPTRPLTGGFDTAIWQVIWRGQPCVLRVFRPEQALTCQREVAAMQAAAAGGIPVPEVIHHGVWEDRPALLLSWVEGKTLLDQLLTSPHLLWPLGMDFGRTQAAVHALPAPAGMNADEWIEWAGDEPELKARLYRLPSRRAALLHLDYHPLNVMANGSRISGVLDWANARAGDPRADFARTYSILRVEPNTPDGNGPVLAIMRRALEWAWRTGYGRAGGKLNEMSLFYAWAGAVMIRDLAPRASDPAHWLQDHHLDSVRVWRDHWKRRAQI